MSWKTIPCSGCSSAAFLSGSSYDSMIAEGRIVDGVVIRHLDLCREPMTEIANLRRELASASRLVRATTVSLAIALAGCAYLGGLAQQHRQEEARWNVSANSTRLAEALIDSQNRNAAQLIEAQNQSTSAFLEELGHAMRVHDETMDRLDNVIDVVDAARKLIQARQAAAAPKPAIQKASIQEAAE